MCTIWSRCLNASQAGDAAADTPESEAAGAIPVGATVKVLVDYKPVREDEVAVSRGELVEVRECASEASSAARAGSGGYLVATSRGEQGWVPGYVLNLLTSTNNPRKPAWTFKKFRKPSFSGSGNGGKVTREQSSPSMLSSVGPNPSVVVVTSGDTAVLKCPRQPGAGVKWTGPSGHLLLNSGRKYSFENDDHLAAAVLYVADCDVKDAGEYSCVQAGGTTVIRLKVKGKEGYGTKLA